jgi:hypothetical protein
MRSERFDAFADCRAPDETLVVSFSRDRGLGVCTLVDAAPGDVLDRFDGQLQPGLSQHSLQVAPGLHIVDTRYVGFLSHGCTPNCRLDMARRELVALREIAAGDWLSIDYAATEDELFRQFACHCGAPECRRWIVGREDEIHAEGIEYLASLASPAQTA